MGDTKPRHYIAGIIIFTMLILGGIGIIDIAIENDPDFATDDYEDFKSATNKRATLQTRINELEAKIKQSENPSPLEVINLFFLKGFQVLQSLFTSLGFMEEVITETGIIFEWIIPEWFPSLLISLATAMLIFSIVSAILQRDI